MSFEKRTIFSTAVSFALHLIAMAILFCVPLIKKSLPPVHEVTLLEAPTVAPAAVVEPSAPQTKSHSPIISGPKPTRLSLKDLSPQYKPSVYDPARSTVASESLDSNSPRFDDPRSYVISSATYDAGNAVRGFVEAVYARINGYLIFDSLLAQYAHFGTVYLEFEVEPTGRIIEESLRASARDRILKVHVIRSALLPGLSKGLSPTLQLKQTENLKLKARFEFVHDASEDSLAEVSPQAINGLSLTFHRVTGEGPVAKNLGQQLTHGGVGYDLFAVYESWKKYNKAREHERIQYDPFAVYRADKYYD